MDLLNLKDLNTAKDLRHPAARFTGLVRPALSRPLISLEKKGGPPMDGESITMQNLTGNNWLF
jgi:hypothetical protein